MDCPACGRSTESLTGVRVDLETNAILIDEMTIHLTSREAEILSVLNERAGRVVSREALIEAVYSHYCDQPSLRTMDLFIGRIRRKLKTYRYMIGTVRGRGYRWVPKDASIVACPPKHVGMGSVIASTSASPPL